MDAPCSVRPIDELKRVFPTLFSHFCYRRHSKMEVGEKVDQVLALPTVEIVSL